jgi:hypothetical protein
MGAIRGLMVRLRSLLHPRVAEHDLDEEIRFHIDLETEKNLRMGIAPGEARRRALVAFGGVQRTKEDHRDVRGSPWIAEGVRDVRFALRALRRTPSLTVAAILTLALGIGAYTALFSAVNAVILRPLPFSDPGRLVMLWEENPDKGWHQGTAAPANMLDWREQVHAFEDVAAYNGSTGNVTLRGTSGGEPEVVTVSRVTGNFFSVLGARAQLGRMLRDDETWNTQSRVVVISDRLWRERFGADPRVVGHALRLVVIAVVLGIGIALAATRMLSALLFHVAPIDPITFVTVPLLLGVTAALATWVPARQASHSDPASVLRGE